MHLSAQTHYQAELDAGRFCIQQCTQCTRHVFTPRELCPHCGASPLRWVRASGQGTVYSTSTVARKSDAGGSGGAMPGSTGAGKAPACIIGQREAQAVAIGIAPCAIGGSEHITHGGCATDGRCDAIYRC